MTINTFVLFCRKHDVSLLVFRSASSDFHRNKRFIFIHKPFSLKLNVYYFISTVHKYKSERRNTKHFLDKQVKQQNHITSLWYQACKNSKTISLEPSTFQLHGSLELRSKN